MSAVRVANAPCSWGVLEFDLEGAAAGAARVLGEMREAGYAGTELGDWGFLPTQPGELRAVLEHHGLALVGAFVPVALARPEAHAEGVRTALRTARLVSAVSPGAFVVLADENGTILERVARAGRIRPEDGLPEATWDVFARGAEQVARLVREETGLRTVFHHHCGGWVETPAEVEALLQRTDPRLLGLCLDTGHWTFGGGDAMEALAQWGDRAWHVHLKDCHPAVAETVRARRLDYFAAVREGVFCELGQGSVDFPAFLAALRDRGYAGWAVVEQDVLPGMGTPLESARRNRAYLAGLGV